MERSATDQYRSYYPEKSAQYKELTREITFQVTERCNLCCSYCYQINKTPKVMSWETAKQIVDGLFKMYDDDVEGAFITSHTEMIVLDFIGGEPMLEIDLIRKICDYFWSTAIRKHHIWAETFMVSFASNGTVYFTNGVQDFFKKYRDHLSYSVSIDGPKEMHDACRVFPDGTGSFDLAKAAQDDYDSRFHHSIGTKATIAQENLPYLSTLIKYYVEQGFTEINANCVYEAYWNLENAQMFYKELKDTADYLLSLDHQVDLALFNEHFFHAKQESDVQNWCFGTDTLVLTKDGYKKIQQIKIGDLVYTQKGRFRPVINIMNHEADNCIKISANGLNPIVCTQNHKFYSRKFKRKSLFGKAQYDRYEKNEIGSLTSKDLLEVHISESTNHSANQFISISGRTFASGLIIEKAPNQVVYNITVEEDHSYIAGGFVVANCGGTGAMLAYDPDGRAYPCVRYMPTSLGVEQSSIVIGGLSGIYNDEESIKTREYLDSIDRRTQSTDECFYCPIAEGCSWCSAWNFQYTGSINKRCTNICIMHKARSLANVYYWNKRYLKEESKKYNHRYLPDDQALEILGQDQLIELNQLEQLAFSQSDTDSPENKNDDRIDETKFQNIYNDSLGQNDILNIEYRKKGHKKNNTTGFEKTKPDEIYRK